MHTRKNGYTLCANAKRGGGRTVCVVVAAVIGEEFLKPVVACLVRSRY